MHLLGQYARPVRRLRTRYAVALGTLSVLVTPAAGSALADPASATLPAIADTYINATAPTQNNGVVPTMRVSAVVNHGLLEFDTSSIPAGSQIGAVTLDLYPLSSPGIGGVAVHPATANWSEAAVTWQQRPPWDSAVLATSDVPSAGHDLAISLPVSSVTPGGMTSYGLSYTPGGILAQIATRESGNPPQLLVTYAGSSGTAPIVRTGTARAETASSATLAGTVDPNGQSTSCHFDYGQTAAYGSATPDQDLGSGSTAVAISASATGLSPSTQYHDRLTCTNTAGTSSGADATFTTSAVAGTHNVTKVLTIVEENHGYTEMFSQMPYLSGLAHQFGYASNYLALGHPSLPNYLGMAAGSTFGETTDCTVSSCPQNGPTVFDQAIAAGETGQVYAEGMTTTCQTTSAGGYLARHTAWPYFVDPTSRKNCAAFQVPSGTSSHGQFYDDVRAGALPTIGWLIPDACNDAHDCSLAVADGWLKTMLALVMSGADWQSGHLAIVVTADEDDNSEGNRVLTVVVHPDLSGTVATANMNSYSLTRFQEQVAGVPYLNNATTATDLAAAFGLTAGS
jgi:acid phosphatase